jgi:hypothetical protein
MKASKEAPELVQHVSIEEVLLEAEKQPSTRDHYFINLGDSKGGRRRRKRRRRRSFLQAMSLRVAQCKGGFLESLLCRLF